MTADGRSALWFGFLAALRFERYALMHLNIIFGRLRVMLRAERFALNAHGLERPQASMYCASPLPKDQFSQAVSARTITISLGGTPGEAARSSVMRL